MDARIKENLLRIFTAAIDAVKPGEALLSHMKIDGHMLHVNGKDYDLRRGRIRAIGAGKGAASLASALESLPGLKIDEGAIVIKDGHGLPLENFEQIEASHPEPNERGLFGAEKLLEIAGRSRPDDLLIVLLTGGASALLPAPANSLNLEAVKQVTSALLASGASIHEINSVRKHLSRISGGQLARAANGAQIIGIIVSDVIGDDLDVIASGPTAPDTSTFADCIRIVEKYGLDGKIPEAALQILKDGAEGKLPETPKPGDAIFANTNNVIVASNQIALHAAAREAESLGYTVNLWNEPMSGDAEEMARRLIDEAKEAGRHLEKGDKDICMLAGGETTVVLRGKGKGGRNQQMALVAAIELMDSDNINCLFAGTDGTDGPTDAAGGFASCESASSMGGVAKARKELAENNSYYVLEKSGDLLKTGPTLTNVMDIAILLISSGERR